MESDKRCILKSFTCIKCNSSPFKKCVPFTDHESNCPTCGHKCREAPVLTIAEKMKKLLAKQSKERRSPFSGSVIRSHQNLELLFKENLFEIHKEFFIDNFSSNFTSNFQNPMTRIVFIKSQKEESDVRPLKPLFIRQLFDMKMNEVYCKEIVSECKREGEEDGKEKEREKEIEREIGYEYPTCMICLRDIEQDARTVVIKCGHLFHYDCIVKMLGKHGICPVCRYDLMEGVSEGNEDNIKNKTIGMGMNNKDKESNFKHSQSHHNTLCYGNMTMNNHSYFNTGNDNDLDKITKEEHDMIYNDINTKSPIEEEEGISIGNIGEENIKIKESHSINNQKDSSAMIPNKILFSINKSLSAQNINIYGNQKAIIS